VRPTVEHHDVRIGAVSHFGLVARPGLANRQPVRERAGAVRAADELAAGGDQNPVALVHRGEDLVERALDRPPELVGVGMDDPVRSEVSGGHAGHVRHPLRALLAVVGVRRAHDGEQAGIRVAGEDVHSLVGGAVVGDDEVVDPQRVVEAQVVLEHVPLVPDLERHDDADRRICGAGLGQGRPL